MDCKRINIFIEEPPHLTIKGNIALMIQEQTSTGIVNFDDAGDFYYRHQTNDSTKKNNL